MLFTDQLAVQPTKPGQYGDYISKILPRRMGNAMPIAYGGCTMGVAVHAASLSIPNGFHLYSAMGYYLGPASPELHLHCTVEKIRDTRSFATRHVQVLQVKTDGSRRTCLDMTLDFHAAEPAWLDYSDTPTRKYSEPSSCPSPAQRAASLVESGHLPPARAEEYTTQLAMMIEYFDTRGCLEGVSSQNLSGMAKGVSTSQDGLPMTQKGSAEWIRTRLPLQTLSEQWAGLAFLMDGGLSFLPLSFMNMGLDEAGACSSLDFALRIFTPEIDIHQWCLKESTSSAAGGGRTYSEARLWNTDGKLMASMTQQSILRPKPQAKAGL